nr:cytochrome P450 [Tanacetum cinerariifolium]
MWLQEPFTTIAELWGQVLILEECNVRRFNRSFKEVCILTNHQHLIHETIHTAIGKDIYPIRVSKIEGEIDMFFNVYSLASSSDEDYDPSCKANVDEDTSWHDKIDSDKDGEADGDIETKLMSQQMGGTFLFLPQSTRVDVDPSFERPPVTYFEFFCSPKHSINGDFSKVRIALERLGSIFDSRGSTRFNDFISNSRLCDLPLGGKHFTIMNRSGSKLSKIDRILVSKHIVDLWPNSHILDLPREFSDHSPLLLTNSCVDFRPSLFKIYNSWLLPKDFPSIFLNSWLNSVGHAHPHPAVNFKLKDMIDAIDTKADISLLTTHDIESRTLLVNELMALEHRNVKDLFQKSKAKRRKKKLMFLKVDFEKAFNTLDWSFLMSVMEQMGFSSKWRNWIFSCLDLTYALVLVNGSLTSEYKVQRGLRQGDTLLHFLFILAVEALNVFADDALIMGDWSLINAQNLSRILNCFHLAFCLKVNFNKSKLYGIGVNTIKVGGGPLKLSFTGLCRLDTNQQCVVSDRAPTFHQHYAITSASIASVTPAIDSQIGSSASQ